MSSRDVLSRPAPLPDLVARYADHPDGLVEAYLPSGAGRHRLVILLHGGFWRVEWDRRHTRPLASALAREGYAVATPEFRRTGGGGGWPTTFVDVSDAVRLIPGLLAGLGVDTERLALLGHSAGGHLALWLAAGGVAGTSAEEVAAGGRRIDRVVALAPVADLYDAFDRDLDGGAVRALLGGGPSEVPERFAAADPLPGLRDGSGPPVEAVHGTEDPLVPVAYSRRLARECGARLREVRGAGHFEPLDPTSTAWPVVLAALEGRST